MASRTHAPTHYEVNGGDTDYGDLDDDDDGGAGTGSGSGDGAGVAHGTGAGRALTTVDGGAWILVAGARTASVGCVPATVTVGAPVSGELRYANGDVYRGQLIGGVPECGDALSGTLLCGDGSSYVGGFARGKFDGLGVHTTRNATYSGEFERGEPCGRGTLLSDKLVLWGDAAAAAECGAYFAEPRLVRVTELAHGMFKRGVLHGAGSRLTSVCVVSCRGDAGQLAECLARIGAAPALATLGAASAHVDGETTTAVAWRAAFARELGEMRRRADAAARSSTPRARLAAGAPGIDKRLSAMLAGGLEVLNVVEHGTWASGSERGGRALSAELVLGGCVPLLDGTACGRVATARVLRADGTTLETRTRAYAGALATNLYHGVGTLTSMIVAPSGAMLVHDVYEGDFAHGVPHGRGALRTLGGKSYDGEFANGLRHGRGVSTSADGTRRTGTRVASVKEGACEFGMPNGDRVTRYYTHGARSLRMSAAPQNTRWALVYVLGIYALPARVRAALDALVPGGAPPPPLLRADEGLGSGLGGAHALAAPPAPFGGATAIAVPPYAQTEPPDGAAPFDVLRRGAAGAALLARDAGRRIAVGAAGVVAAAAECAPRARAEAGDAATEVRFELRDAEPQ